MTDNSSEPSSIHNHRRRQRGRISPNEYLNRVDVYEKVFPHHALFSGTHFRKLNVFLGPQARDNNLHVNAGDAHHPALLYDHQDKDHKHGHAFKSSDELLLHCNDAFWEKNHSNVLFLNGHMSSEWLSTAGATFGIDPEFYRRHLYYQGSDVDGSFSSKCPLSAMSNMARLKITTLIVRTPSSETNNQDELEDLRLALSTDFEAYTRQLKRNNGFKSSVGDSIVRNFTVHDHRHFSIEQDLSIYGASPLEDYVVVVWSDLGRSLSKNCPGPWIHDPLDKSTIKLTYVPTVLHDHNVATRTRPRRKGELNEPNGQNAALLARDYGRTIDSEVAAEDPLYALREAFFLSAASEIQFLNMMESVIEREQERSTLRMDDNTKPTISNFVYNRQALSRHISRLRANVEFIEAARDTWPKPSKQILRKTANSVTELILKDFRYLLKRAEELSVECERGINIVMHHANIQESREAISRAKQATKLTRLAFFFIPLSLTTSFFGMNFVEIGNDRLSIWVWFVASIPVLLISMMILWDVPETVKRKFAEALKRQPSTVEQFPMKDLGAV